MRVFSLHIDTARTWRGGQGQVMYTVMGLRARRQRAALVAHPEGELFRRMSEGTDLIPLAPRNEIDLAAAWRLSRVLKQLKPRRHSRARSARRGHGGDRARRSRRRRRSRRSSRRGASSSASRTTRSRAGSTDRSTASSPSARPSATGSSPTASREQKTTVVNEGVDVERIVHLPAANVHAAFYLPTHAPVVGNVGALVPHKGQHHLIDAAAIVVRAVPDVALRHLRRRRAAAGARGADQAQASRAPRVPGRLPPRRRWS